MPMFTMLAVFVLILLSATFSGLTLGLFSLDKTELKRKSELGDVRAKKIYHVRKKSNLLLVSLLLANVAANATISILLAQVASGVIAGFTATGLIVLFGEILPQAAFSRFALETGAKTVWIAEILLVVLYPIAAPIAWILDRVLGEKMDTIWTKRELEHIIAMHEDHPHSVVDADEERILLGALRFSDRTAEEVMTPREKTFTLEVSDTIGEKLLHRIKEEGYTRIPILKGEEEQVVGLLYAKDLIGVDETTPVISLLRTNILVRVTPNRKLDEVLNMMIARHAHMAVVTEKSGAFVGIVTMEDIMEEIIGREIVDEEDVF